MDLGFVLVVKRVFGDVCEKCHERMCFSELFATLSLELRQCKHDEGHFKDVKSKRVRDRIREREEQSKRETERPRETETERERKRERQKR